MKTSKPFPYLVASPDIPEGIFAAIEEYLGLNLGKGIFPQFLLWDSTPGAKRFQGFPTSEGFTPEPDQEKREQAVREGKCQFESEAGDRILLGDEEWCVLEIHEIMARVKSLAVKEQCVEATSERLVGEEHSKVEPWRDTKDRLKKVGRCCKELGEALSPEIIELLALESITNKANRPSSLRCLQTNKNDWDKIAGLCDRAAVKTKANHYCPVV